jgi:hypothetical protein
VRRLAWLLSWIDKKPHTAVESRDHGEKAIFSVFAFAVYQVLYTLSAVVVRDWRGRSKKIVFLDLGSPAVGCRAKNSVTTGEFQSSIRNIDKIFDRFDYLHTIPRLFPVR